MLMWPPKARLVFEDIIFKDKTVFEDDIMLLLNYMEIDFCTTQANF